MGRGDDDVASVPETVKHRALADALAVLPPVPVDDQRSAIRAEVAANPRHKVVVLDDDPTGTQTVHDVPVLTMWDVATLRSEFAGPAPCFYILTNSRSMIPRMARALNVDLARNVQQAAGGRPFTLISRSDSTLRGHFPLETDARRRAPRDEFFTFPRRRHPAQRRWG